MKKIIFILMVILASCTSLEEKLDIENPPKPERDDSFIYIKELKHNSFEDIIVNSDTEIAVIFRSRVEDIEKVSLVIKGRKKSIEMERISSGKKQDCYLANVDVKEGDETLDYAFLIEDGKLSYYFSKSSSSKKKSIEYFSAKIDRERVIKVPEWSIGAIWYEIVIDRFRNGNVENDPILPEVNRSKFLKSEEKLVSETEKSSLLSGELFDESGATFNVNRWNGDWNSKESWEKKQEKIANWDSKNSKHYGGDLLGIIEKADYIKGLGVDAVLLSTPFYSDSFHKQGVGDFRHISPAFGVIEQTGNRYGIDTTGENVYVNSGMSEYKLLEFKNGKNSMGESLKEGSWNFTESDILFFKMIEELHKKEIRVGIRAPFEYVGDEFWAFEDVMIKGPNSEYRDWFDFTDWSKVTRHFLKNSDEWNPGVEYSGEATFGVYKESDKTMRRRWVKIDSVMSKEEQREIFEWNLANVRYRSFGDRSGLPILNYKNEEVFNYVKESFKKWAKGLNVKDSATEEVTRVLLDAIVFEAIEDEQNWEYLEKMKKEIKLLNSEIFIGGESLKLDEKEVTKKRFDSIYDYSRGDLAIKFFINQKSTEKITKEKFEGELGVFDKIIQKNSYFSSLKAIGSMATDRVHSMIINSDRAYDTKNSRDDKNYLNIRPDLYKSSTIEKLKLIAFYNLFLPGSPVIYYGDEVAMWGADFPDSTKPMIWEEFMPYELESDELEKYKNIKSSGEAIQRDEANSKVYYEVKGNSELREWYKELIELRRERGELFKRGELEFIELADTKFKDLVIFKRVYKKEEAIVILNRAEREIEVSIPIDDGREYSDLVSGEDFVVVDDILKVKVPRSGGVVFLKK